MPRDPVAFAQNKAGLEAKRADRARQGNEMNPPAQTPAPVAQQGGDGASRFDHYGEVVESRTGNMGHDAAIGNRGA
jgi:hypothetical protein